MTTHRLVLASNSPRRRELLALAGFEFEQLSVDIDESVRPDEKPGTYTLRVSLEKAQAARQLVADDTATIITADTTVADGETILGKPVDAAEAEAMLRQLRDRVHQVYTALAVVRGEQFVQELASTDVQMRPYANSEIAAYIDSGDPFDKAGGYAIQNRAFDPVAAIEGCYANVVGLPLCHLVKVLRQFDISPAVDVPAACQQANYIDCPVYSDILASE